MLALALLFGAIVGFSLGLTGGGGSIFAVPLLVYGLAIPAHEAVGVSLAAVGSTALMGSLQRLRAGEIEKRAGLIFAGAGMIGAPVGSALGGRIPEAVLLSLFALLMAVVAIRMWIKASPGKAGGTPVRARVESSQAAESTSACRRDGIGAIRFTSVCAVTLSGAGVATGVLAGMFGVGGGFVVVPALVLLTGMNIHRAVATSLLVIALISASGVTSYVVAGRPMNWGLTGVFVLGGVVGLLLGTMVGRRLSGPGLQRLFSVAIIVVAVFMIVKTLVV